MPMPNIVDSRNTMVNRYHMTPEFLIVLAVGVILTSIGCIYFELRTNHGAFMWVFMITGWQKRPDGVLYHTSDYIFYHEVASWFFAVLLLLAPYIANFMHSSGQSEEHQYRMENFKVQGIDAAKTPNDIWHAVWHYTYNYYTLAVVGVLVITDIFGWSSDMLTGYMAWEHILWIIPFTLGISILTIFGSMQLIVGFQIAAKAIRDRKREERHDTIADETYYSIEAQAIANGSGKAPALPAGNPRREPITEANGIAGKTNASPKISIPDMSTQRINS